MIRTQARQATITRRAKAIRSDIWFRTREIPDSCGGAIFSTHRRGFVAGADRTPVVGLV